MQYRYTTQGTCCREMIIDVENNIVKDVLFLGGCSGNLQGIAKLVAGMPMNEVITRLQGIQCGAKGTSCPDQLSNALQAITEKENNK